MSVFALMYLFIYKRFIKKSHFSQKTKKYITIFLLSTYLGVLGYMLSRYYISVPNSVYFILSLSIGIGFVFFFITILYEIATQSIKISKNDSRRDFFRKVVDYSVLFGGSAYASGGAIEAMKVPTIVDVDIKIKDIKKPQTIVQLSDVHIGGLIDYDFIKALVARVNTLNADTIVITGDLIDTDISIIKDTVDELKNLKSKNGTYFVLGNHEYFHNPYAITTYLESIGINVLKNSSQVIDDSYNLIGVYDRFGYRFDDLVPSIGDAMSSIDTRLPNVLLAHQPKYLDEIETKDIDLALCGHTHGGQIFPFSLLVKLQQPYLKGLYKKDNTSIYVNRGTGFWGPPMRMMASSEITRIRLS
jgi:predicted MPP superfamily phosphohydrolase